MKAQRRMGKKHLHKSLHEDYKISAIPGTGEG